MNRKIKSTIWAVVLLVMGSMAWAEIIPSFNFQGRLTDDQGVPYTGLHSMTISLYDVAGGGSSLMSKTYPNLDIKNGYVNIQIVAEGSMDFSDLPFDRQYWVGVQVDGLPEMTPREKLSHVAYAMWAKTSVQAESATVAATALHADEADHATTATTATTALSANNGLPAGAIIMYRGLSCPAGFTELAGSRDLFPRGGTNFSGVHVGGADSHSHGASSATSGAHTHTFSGTTGLVTGKEPSVYPNDADGPSGDHKHTYSGTTSQNGNHSHTITVNPSDNIPRYFNVIFCVKD